MKNSLDSVVFVSLKESAALSGKGFAGFDPAIPLPVRLDLAEEAAGEGVALSALSEESVLSGILAVFAQDPENANREYYRNLALKIRPGLRRELAGVALAEMRNGNWDQAEEIFLALRGMNPLDREIVLNLAILYDEKARKGGDGSLAFEKKAESLYAECIGMDPPLPEAFFNAAYFCLWQKNYARALDSLKAYLALETATGKAAQTRKKKAKSLIRKIESRGLCDSLFMTAYAAIASGQEERALEYIRLFLESHPGVWNAWFLLGKALRRLGRRAEGKAALIKALELRQGAGGGKSEDETGEGIADICNEIAACAMEENSLEESRRWLLAALEHEPENAKAISSLGVLARKEGNMKEAESFFLAAAEINPDCGVQSLKPS